MEEVEFCLREAQKKVLIPIENVNVAGSEIHKKESYRKCRQDSYTDRQCRWNLKSYTKRQCRKWGFNSYRERQCRWDLKS